MDRNKTRKAVVGATIVMASIATQQTMSLAQQRPVQPARPAPKQPEGVAPDTIINADGSVVFQGITFPSGEAALRYFQASGRCGTQVDQNIWDGGIAGGATTDCSTTLTNPNAAAIYAPAPAATVKFRVPVVFHVCRNAANSLGNLTLANVQANINVLNEDFKALAGSPGAPGTNVQIEYVLTDDFGTTPGTGVLYYSNDTLYGDGGAYYNAGGLAPTKTVLNYLNIYTNTAGGNLGYVPALPMEGIVGNAADRVVIDWHSVGDPCPFPADPVYQFYCQGRTVTHEVGHFMGLYHVFQGGCAAGNCYTVGDRVCDTNNDQTSHFGCTAGVSCGLAIPIANYMEYTDDPCMNNFSNEQSRRMRCGIDNWRTSLPFRIPIFAGNFTGTPNTLTPAPVGTTGTTICDLDGQRIGTGAIPGQSGMSDGAGDAVGAYAGTGSLVEAGDEVGYKIVHPGGYCNLTLTGLSSDLDLFLLGAAGTPASAIGASTAGSTANERIAVANLPAGTYYVVVETFAVSTANVYGSNYMLRYSRCAADITGDNAVNADDLLAVINGWGACPGACPPACAADIAPPAVGNCQVNSDDLLLIISGWGGCP